MQHISSLQNNLLPWQRNFIIQAHCCPLSQPESNVSLNVYCCRVLHLNSRWKGDIGWFEMCRIFYIKIALHRGQCGRIWFMLQWKGRCFWFEKANWTVGFKQIWFRRLIIHNFFMETLNYAADILSPLNIYSNFSGIRDTEEFMNYNWRHVVPQTAVNSGWLYSQRPVFVSR